MAEYVELSDVRLSTYILSFDLEIPNLPTMASGMLGLTRGLKKMERNYAAELQVPEVARSFCYSIVGYI